MNVDFLKIIKEKAKGFRYWVYLWVLIGFIVYSFSSLLGLTSPIYNTIINTMVTLMILILDISLGLKVEEIIKFIHSKLLIINEFIIIIFLISFALFVYYCGNLQFRKTLEEKSI